MGLVRATAYGDPRKLHVKVEDGKFKTSGCGLAIVCSSLVTEWIKALIKAKTLDGIVVLKKTDIVKESLILPEKLRCSVLAEDDDKAALENYKKNLDK